MKKVSYYFPLNKEETHFVKIKGMEVSLTKGHPDLFSRVAAPPLKKNWYEYTGLNRKYIKRVEKLNYCYTRVAETE